MGWFDDARSDHQETYGEGRNQAEWTHELAAGGAAFAGMKAWEDHQRNEGQPVSHAFAKELLAGFVGAEVDKLAETKGEDAWDRHKAKKQAEARANEMYDEHYIQGHGAEQWEPRYDPPNFNY